MIKTGDIVKVKSGIKVPDFEYELMDGWQGRLLSLDKDGLAEIALDAQTLLVASQGYLIDLISQGYDHEIMFLNVSELGKVENPDPSRNNEQTKTKANARAYWIELYEKKAPTYLQLFKGINIKNEDELLKKWEEYLNENLSFPVKAKVFETDGGNLRYGTKITIKAIVETDDYYGLLITGTTGKERHIYPLCNLRAENDKDSAADYLEDYSYWFTNH